MPIAQWLQQQFSRGSGRKRAARRDFQKRFAAQLGIKPLESRLVLSGGPVTTELALTLAGNLTITDVALGGKNDNLTLTADIEHDRLTIYDPTAILSVSGFSNSTVSNDCHTVEVALSEITAFEVLVDTQDGDDLLTLDYSQGENPLAVQFNGGTELEADFLELTGNTFSTSDYLLTNVREGTISIAGNGSVRYENIEQVTDNLTIDDRQFVFAAGSEAITLQEANSLNQLQYEVGGTPSELLEFTTPTNALAVNAGDGDDILDLQGTAPDFTASLSIYGGAGDDFIHLSGVDPNLTGPLSIAGSSGGIVASRVANIAFIVGPSENNTLNIDNGFATNLSLSGMQTVNLNAVLTGVLTGDATTVNVANTAQIQDGLDLAGVDAAVNVAAGTYLENVNIYKPVMLLGPNAVVNPVTNSAGRSPEAIIDGGLGDAVTVTTAGNVTLAGFTLLGNRGIVDPGADLVIQNMIISTAATAVDVSTANSAVILDNVITSANDIGIYGYTVATTVTVQGNAITAFNSGVFLDIIGGAVLIGGDVAGQGNGIDLTGSFATNGIFANQLGSTFTAQGNVITGVSNMGIQVSHFDGLAVIGGDSAAEANDITTVDANAYGIYASNLAYVSLADVTIQGNVVNSAGSGIWLEELQGNTLVGGATPAEGNQITSVFAGVLDLAYSAPGLLTLQNNQINSGSSGVVLTDIANTVTAIGNTINAANYGFEIGPVAAASLIQIGGLGSGEGNAITVTGGFGYGINSILPHHLTIQGNTIIADSWGVYTQNVAGNLLIQGNQFSSLNFGGGLFAIEAFDVSGVTTIGGFGIGEANTIDGFTFGVSLSSAVDVEIANNQISNVLVGVSLSNMGTVNNPVNVDSNIITGIGVGPYGIFLDNASLTAPVFATIQRNTISGFVAGISALEATATITNNFSNSNDYGVEVSGSASNVVAFENDFSGNNLLAINNTSGVLVDASGNWYGANTETGVAAAVTADVDYTPWLNSGTDTDLVTAGFQGDFSHLHVDDNSPQTGFVGRIMEGYQLLTGGPLFLQVHAGTYVENADFGSGVDKGVTILTGASPGQVILNGNLTLTSNDTFPIEIDGVDPLTEYDNWVVTGIVTLNNATLLTSGSITTVGGNQLMLIDNDGSDPVNGIFNGYSEGAVVSVSGLNYRITYSGGDGNDVVLSADTLVSLDVSGNLVITDIFTNTNDNLTISFDGVNYTITDPGRLIGTTVPGSTGDGTDTIVLPGAAVFGSQIFVNTLAGNDLLTLDYTPGLFSKELTYDGGSGFAGDRLLLVGNSFTAENHAFVSLNAGTITLTGTPAVNYAQVERVTDLLNVGARQFTFTAAAETITLAENGSLNTLQYDAGSGPSELVEFTIPATSLSLLAGDGDDVIDLVGIRPGLVAALEVLGETGADTINVPLTNPTPFIAPGSDVTLSAEAVNILQPPVGKNIVITAAAIDIAAPLVAVQNITLRPINDSATIGLDGSGTFNLTMSELNNLQSNGTVEIGRTTGTGAIDLGTVNFSSKNFNLTLLGGDTTFNGGVTLSANKTFTMSVGTITSPNMGTDVTLPNGTLVITANGPIGTATDPLKLDIRNLETNSAAANGDQFLQNVTPGPIFLTPLGLNAGTATIHLLGSVFVLGGSERIADTSALVFDGTFFAVGGDIESVRQFTLVNGNVAGGGSGKIISQETIRLENGVVQVKLEGSAGLTKATAGTVEVFQPMTYPGDTLIDAGTLKLATTQLIPHGAGNGDVTINANGTLDLNGFAETINGLSGNGKITNAGGIVQFTVGADDDTSSFTGDIQGNLLLFKVGAGTLTLAGTNTYLPATVVVNGAVHLTGSTTANTFVQNGATFGGTGTTTGTVNVNPGGTLAPGVTIGRLTTGDVTLNGGSFFETTIDGNDAGVDYDQLVVNGMVTLNNAILSVNGSIPNVGANEIVLIANDSNDPINGIFQGLPEGAIVPVNGHNYRLSYIGGDGNDVALSADTLVSLVSGNLTITDIFTTTNDNLTIFSDVANSRYIITDPGRIIGTTIPGAVGDGTSTIFVSFASVSGSEIHVNTLDGSDRLTINYSLGLFAKSVVFDGGDSSGAPNDQLLLTGGGLLNTVAHTLTTETDGTISSTGNAIVSYQNLEGLTDSLSATNRSFTFNGGDETITLTDDPAAGFNQIDSTMGIGLVFANPLGSLSVHAGSGNDHVVTGPLDPALSAALNFQINGGSGTNEWTFNTSLTADVDVVQITGSTVQLQTNAIAKPTIVYSAFDTLNVNTYGGSDQITVQLGGPLPATINLDGGQVETPDIVTIRGNQTLADRLRLDSSQIVDQVTGKVIQFTDIEQLVVNLAGDIRDDQVTIERTFALTGGTPSVTVQGDGSPLDHLIVNTEPTLASVTADVVAIDADSVDLVGWLPILYSGLEQVTLNTGAGNDLIAVTPSSNTRLVIDGGPAALPTFPGDRVEFNLTGVVTPTLAIPDPGAGLLASANRREVQLINIETFAATGTGTFVVTLDANSSATNDAPDGNADTFNLVRQGTTTEIAVNGQTVFRGERANIAEIQITGSADNDAATVDFAAGNPLSPGGLQFMGNGGTNSLQLIQGSVERIVHNIAGPQAGLITIDEIVGPGTVTSTISYTQINSPLFDDLLTNTRELHLTSADDNVILRENSAANRSEIINAGAATFVDLIQRNPTNNLLITGNAGNDTFTIDSNGNGPGGTVAFVAFAVEIVGGPGELDHLVVNDTSNGTNATLAVTETTLDFGGGVIRYRGMEDVDLTLGSGNDQVTLTDDPLINADPEANAAATFTLHTGAGHDVVNITSIDAGYRASTTIVGEAGNDQITQLVDLTLGSAISAGNLTYSAERIELAANLATTGGFAKYAGNVTLLTDVRIDTDDTDAGVAGGTIVFTQTVDSSLAGAKNLALDAGIANIVFSAGVGVTQPLQNLTIDEAYNLSFLGQLQTLGNVTQTTGTGQTLFNGTAGSGIGGQLQVQTNVIDFATGDIVTAGNIDLTAANQITLATNAGINATAATIRFAANQDNVGNENFTQDATALVQTTSNAANAVTLLVGANGSALISDVRTGSTGGVTINVGGAIVDNSAAETPNVTAGQATLTAGTGIGVGGGAADFDTQIAMLTAPANGGDIVIQEVDALTLQGITTSGGRVQISAGGLLTIQDTTAVTNATGQVSNIPPILRIDEANPNDVILPGDPTQEISGTFGGDQLLGDNLELVRNLTFTAFWADGVVSQVSGLNAGDTLTWIVGPQGQGTPVITPGLVQEGPIHVFVQRHYTFLFLQTVTTPDLVSHFTISNDSKIVLQDQRAIPVNLNFTGPLAIATSISKTDFRPPPILLVPPPVPVAEVRRPSLIVEIATASSSRTITYEEIETVVDEADEEEAQLYLVQVGIDGTEGPRIKIPLAELRNLAGLLDRLKQAPIPNGLYRIYHQEPGLTSRQLIEFRKAGKNIGDPVREPGRGSNPLEAPDKKPAIEAPGNNQSSLDQQPAVEATAATTIAQAFSRTARWRRQWEA